MTVGEEDRRDESLIVGLQFGLRHIAPAARVVPMNINVLVLLGRRFEDQNVARWFGNPSRRAYRVIPTLICRRLLRHWTILACSLARDKAGRSRPARIAMMAMTTKSSTNVNALGRMQRDCFQGYRATTLKVARAFMGLIF